MTHRDVYIMPRVIAGCLIRLRWSRATAICVALLSFSAPGIAHGAEQVIVEAARHGTAIAINARATIRAPHFLIWQTLTDYEHLAEFVPGIEKSHVIDRRGGTVTVEQDGRASLWFFTYPIEVVVESLEQPPSAIAVKLLKGNLKQLDGGYQIEKVDAGDNEYVLRWSGIIEPATNLPFFIAIPLIRANISDQFLGMIREIERREARRTHSPSGQ